MTEWNEDPDLWKPCGFVVSEDVLTTTRQALYEGGRQDAKVDFTGREIEYDTDNIDKSVPSAETNCWLSQIVGMSKWHLPVFDVDVPKTRIVENDVLVTSPGKVALFHQHLVRWVPSSTEGHHHVYVDIPMSWTAYSTYLGKLAERGVIEQGYLQASEHHGYTVVRKPGVPKIVVCGNKIGRSTCLREPNHTGHHWNHATQTEATHEWESNGLTVRDDFDVTWDSGLGIQWAEWKPGDTIKFDLPG